MNMDKESIEYFENNNQFKNCKNHTKICKNELNNGKNKENIAKIDKIFSKPLYSKKEDYFVKMKAYVKALLSIYPTLPNIINIVDGIIEKRATSSISMSSIYAGTSHTYKQIEKMIDMSERKCKLLNIFSLVKGFLGGMSLKDYEIVDLRFFRRKKISEISERLELDERTIFRRLNKILESVVKYCNINSITLEMIETMIRGEGWIKEIYKKALEEFSVNKARGLRSK